MLLLLLAHRGVDDRRAIIRVRIDRGLPLAIRQCGGRFSNSSSTERRCRARLRANSNAELQLGAIYANHSQFLCFFTAQSFFDLHKSNRHAFIPAFVPNSAVAPSMESLPWRIYRINWQTMIDCRADERSCTHYLHPSPPPSPPSMIDNLTRTPAGGHNTHLTIVGAAAH